MAQTINLLVGSNSILSHVLSSSCFVSLLLFLSLFPLLLLFALSLAVCDSIPHIRRIPTYLNTNCAIISIANADGICLYFFSLPLASLLILEQLVVLLCFFLHYSWSWISRLVHNVCRMSIGSQVTRQHSDQIYYEHSQRADSKWKLYTKNVYYASKNAYYYTFTSFSPSKWANIRILVARK